MSTVVVNCANLRCVSFGVLKRGEGGRGGGGGVGSLVEGRGSLTGCLAILALRTSRICLPSNLSLWLRYERMALPACRAPRCQ